jgi:hypothetical protein
MLARRLMTILPAMTLAEALDTTRIHRVAGRTDGRTALVTSRPCRAPHHPISDVGRSGGVQVPLPGKAPLTHHSILFLTSGRSANAMSSLGCGSHFTSLLVLMELALLGARVNAAPAEPATRSVEPRASPAQDDPSGAAHR